MENINDYNYDKSIKDKNKTVQSLKAEIAALEGVQDAASKAELARKRAELADAEEDLNDTISEHQIELSQDALTGMKDALQDAFDDKWDNIHSDLGAIAELMSAANELTSSSAQAINQNLSELLKYYGVNPATVGIDTSNIKGYADGTKYVPKTGTYLTDEEGLGSELFITKNGVLRTLNQGDTVLSKVAAANLFEMAETYPSWKNMTPEIVRPTIKVTPEMNAGGDINVHYDSVIHVDGNVDKNIVTDIKEVGKNLLKDRSFMQGTYNFTTKEIVKDARTHGIKVKASGRW